MRRLLRSLEKKLVVERTELAVVPLVHDLLSRWEDALGHDHPTPDPLDFVASLIRSGFCLTTVPKAFSYLDECQRRSSLPERDRLLRALVPGHTFRSGPVQGNVERAQIKIPSPFDGRGLG